MCSRDRICAPTHSHWVGPRVISFIIFKTILYKCVYYSRVGRKSNYINIIFNLSVVRRIFKLKYFFLYQNSI